MKGSAHDPELAKRTDSQGPLVLHVPHASRTIPAALRSQFVLSDADLEAELLAMTDAHTDRLFTLAAPGADPVVFPVSRLVVDPERFANDEDEPMSRVGMGVVYMRTSRGQPLRRALTGGERERLLETYYVPHHRYLAEAARRALDRNGRCLLVDCHSFPSVPLPCEPDQDPGRPDICIGTDEAHTPPELVRQLSTLFETRGLRVAVNRPFSGALVPDPFHRKESRVAAVMVEVNRRLYMDEHTGSMSGGFESVSRTLAAALDLMELTTADQERC